MRQARFHLTVVAVVWLAVLALQVGPAWGKGTPPPPSGGSVDALQAQVAALEAQVATLQAQVAALQNSPVQDLADYVSVDLNDINGLKGPHVIFTGANVHVRSGADRTEDAITGLGNLVVGYNERLTEDEIRSGSHNLVVGIWHTYTKYGCLVAGIGNRVTGPFSSVTGGNGNIASGSFSSVSGGGDNTASGIRSSVSGGGGNEASGNWSSISGGGSNKAAGLTSSISGGLRNKVEFLADLSSILGGKDQTADTDYQTIPALP
jgi:hypothetical protein